MAGPHIDRELAEVIGPYAPWLNVTHLPCLRFPEGDDIDVVMHSATPGLRMTVRDTANGVSHRFYYEFPPVVELGDFIRSCALASAKRIRSTFN